MSINCAKKLTSSELCVTMGDKKHRKKKTIKKKMRTRPLESAEISDNIAIMGKEISLIPTASLTQPLTTKPRKRTCPLNLRAASVNPVRLRHTSKKLSTSQSLWDVSHKDVSCKTTSELNSLAGAQGCNTSAVDHLLSCSVQPLNIKGVKKPVVPLLTAIKPENEKSEKERFFQARFCYNPVFIYRNPADMDALERFSTPSGKYLAQVLSVIVIKACQIQINSEILLSNVKNNCTFIYQINTEIHL